jgi:hypothetical protein
MGVRASLDRGQRVFGSSRLLATYDDAGRELVRWEESDEHELILGLVQFVDLADGRRITTEGFAVLTLTAPLDSTLAHLRDELREFVFEEEAGVEDELDEPRWEALTAALTAGGVAADAEGLRTLPFVIEVDPEVAAALRR